MLRLVRDRHGVAPDVPDDIVIRSERDYVAARLRLRELGEKAENACLIVRGNPAIERWFVDFEEHGLLDVSICDPVAALREYLGIEQVPESLTRHPASLAALDILKQAKPLKIEGDEDVYDWLLATYVAPIWAARDIASPDTFKQLVEFYLMPRPSVDPLLAELQKRRLNIWQAASVPKPWPKVLKWFFESDPYERARIILIAQATKRFREEAQQQIMQRDAMWQKYRESQAIVDLVINLPEIEGGTEVLEAYVGPHVKAILQDMLRSMPLDEVLARCSGKLNAELQAVVAHVEVENQELKKDDVHQLQEKFQALVTPTVLAQVEDHVAVPAPPAFNQGWGWPEVAEWVCNAYLPYYRWTRRTQHGETAAYAADYESWLHRNYAKLAQSLTPLIYGLPARIEEALKAGPVLWLVIDCLGWEWQRQLLRILEDKGLNAHAPVEPRLSMLPSVTSVSKPCLVRGQLPSQFLATGASDYAALLQARFPGRRVAVHNDNEMPLIELVKREAGKCELMLYLYNAIDNESHKPNKETARRQKLRELMLTLAEQLFKAAWHHKQVTGRHLRIAVASDHGATTLPASAEVVAIPAWVGQDYNAHHQRVVDWQGKAPGDVPAGWHYLDPASFALPAQRPCLVTQTYRFLGAKTVSGLHGGLTPEETVVPFVVVSLEPPPVFTRVELQQEQLVVGQAGQIELTLRIGNPNELPLEDLTLTWQVQGSGESIAQKAVLQVQSGAEQVHLAGRLPPGQGAGTLKTECVLACRYAGAPQTATVAVDIAVGQPVAETELGISIKGSIKRGRSPCPVYLAVQNPNAQEIGDLRVLLRTEGLETNAVVPSAPAGQQIEQLVHMNVPSRIAKEFLIVEVHASYTLGGGARSQRLELSVNTEGAMLVDDEFDNMFDI